MAKIVGDSITVSTVNDLFCGNDNGLNILTLPLPPAIPLPLRLTLLPALPPTLALPPVLPASLLLPLTLPQVFSSILSAEDCTIIDDIGAVPRIVVDDDDEEDEDKGNIVLPLISDVVVVVEIVVERKVLSEVVVSVLVEGNEVVEGNEFEGKEEDEDVGMSTTKSCEAGLPEPDPRP